VPRACVGLGYGRRLVEVIRLRRRASSLHSSSFSSPLSLLGGDRMRAEVGTWHDREAWYARVWIASGRGEARGKRAQRSRRLTRAVVRVAIASPCYGAGEGASRAREREARLEVEGKADKRVPLVSDPGDGNGEGCAVR
jgi:hypothetical protein